jgi:hypothetical protein
MEQSTKQANSCPNTEESSSILWNSNVHCHAHKNPLATNSYRQLGEYTPHNILFL